MSLQEALDRAGVTINHENKPDGAPTKGAFSRIIDAVRKAESASEKRVTEANERSLLLTNQVTQLTAELQKCKAQLLQSQMSEKMDRMERLTIEDKSELLDVVISSVANPVDESQTMPLGGAQAAS